MWTNIKAVTYYIFKTLTWIYGFLYKMSKIMNHFAKEYTHFYILLERRMCSLTRSDFWTKKHLMWCTPYKALHEWQRLFVCSVNEPCHTPTELFIDNNSINGVHTHGLTKYVISNKSFAKLIENHIIWYDVLQLAQNDRFQKFLLVEILEKSYFSFECGMQINKVVWIY